MEDEIRRFKQKKLNELREAQAHKNDSPAAKEVWRKAVADIKDIDVALRGGANTLAGIKTATSHNASLVSEINKELGIAEEVVVAKEAVVAEKAVVEPEQTSDGGVFSARLEALISAALQDGVLTEQEKAILKKRAEAEGEDWDEVEMIINARLAERQPTPQVENGVEKNIVDEKDIVGTPSNTPVETKSEVKLDDPIFDADKAGVYNEKNVDIPEGYTEIIEETFEDSNLESISLPSTLKKIGDNAFERCDKMKKVDFSKCTSLIEIGDMVFRWCTKLEEIVLPDSVTTIGDGAFSHCTELRKIVMPSSLEKLGDSVFEECDSLEEVDMSKVTKLTTIPKRFETGDDEQMVIPMGVTTIRKDAFEYCNKYALFLPPTLKDYMDKNGDWESVYLFASPLEKMDNILENCENLYVLPQYLEVYKSIHEALGSWCEIHTIPDEYLYYYDN